MTGSDQKLCGVIRQLLSAVIFALITASPLSPVIAEVFYLKSGDKIEGKIVYYDSLFFAIQLADGSYRNFNSDEVSRVKFDGAGLRRKSANVNSEASLRQRRSNSIRTKAYITNPKNRTRKRKAVVIRRATPVRKKVSAGQKRPQKKIPVKTDARKEQTAALSPSVTKTGESSEDREATIIREVRKEARSASESSVEESSEPAVVNEVRRESQVSSSALTPVNRSLDSEAAESASTSQGDKSKAAVNSSLTTAAAESSVTESSVTESSVAESSVTESSVTESSATESSATESSATESSATESSATESSATESSATESSATESSVTESSVTESSVTESSVTESSATESSATESSATESSATEPSATESSATESSVAESSVAESSATEPSDAEPSVTESSVTESSATESSVAESSATESSATESSVTESSVAESSVAESSVAESSVAESSQGEEPSTPIYSSLTTAAAADENQAEAARASSDSTTPPLASPAKAGESETSMDESDAMDSPELEFREAGQLFIPGGKMLHLKSRNDRELDRSEVFYSINDGRFRSYREPIVFNSSGIYNIRFYGVDAVGNRERLNHAAVVVDDEPPEVSFSMAANFVTVDGWHYSTKRNLQVYVHDKFAGVYKLSCSVNGQKQEFTSGAQLPLSDSSEEQLVECQAIDRVGNRSAREQLHFKLLKDGPTLEWSSAGNTPEEYAVINRNTELYFSLSNNPVGLSQLELLVNGKSYQMPLNSRQFHPYNFIDAPGRFDIQLRARDRLGNVTISTKRSFLLDTRPPASQIELVK